MTLLGARAGVKRALARLPLAAEVFQVVLGRGHIPAGGYSLESLAQVLPGWVEAVRDARTRAPFEPHKRVLVVGYLCWWLEYVTALTLLLAGEGHEVDLAFLPYRRWMQEISPFDARRQSANTRSALCALRGLVQVHDLSSGNGAALPSDLEDSIAALSRTDVQYSLQRESLDLEGGSVDASLYGLRLRRNRQAASRGLRLIREGQYDVVIVPNGSILEFGAIYRVARYQGTKVVTFEFGEQRERMWLAQDAEVMRQDTSSLWQARGDQPLKDEELNALKDLYLARRGGKLWSNFGRQWQAAESQGAQNVRHQLVLDRSRPVVLLCTNVVGDSLALGREVFTDGMADWLAQTAAHFAARPNAQLVVRVHPGELLGAGHPSEDIVKAAVPQLPPHVLVVPPDSKINTYDLIELAHLGLVYTTTVGMEMAMGGVPVIVAGQTHYRGKGFTLDPATQEDYLRMVDEQVHRPAGTLLGQHEVELAWRYAHRFFFEFPLPFPWHLVHFWDDIRARPLNTVLRPEGRKPYERTLRALLGEPIDWRSGDGSSR